MIQRLLLAACVGVVPGLFFLACGGGTSASSGANDASLPADSGGFTSSDTGADSADTGTSSADDAGSDAAGPNCSALATKACRSCCATAYPSGYTAFAALERSCACVPDLCGPLEGGVGDASDDDAGAAEDGGDASVFGEGACTATCSSSATPAGTCVTCLQQTLGSTTAEGPCAESEAAQCVTSATCAPFLDCVLGCP